MVGVLCDPPRADVVAVSDAISYEPMTEEARANVQGIVDQLARVGEAIGGWSTKSDNRQTGASVPMKFERTVDVATTIAFVEQLQQAPALLSSACEKLLTADAALAAMRDSLRASYRGDQ